MMNKIKHALSFIFGMLYMWAIFYQVAYPTPIKNMNPIYILAFAIGLFGSIGLFLAILIFFTDYWKKE